MLDTWLDTFMMQPFSWKLVFAASLFLPVNPRKHGVLGLATPVATGVGRATWSCLFELL